MAACKAWLIFSYCISLCEPKHDPLLRKMFFSTWYRSLIPIQRKRISNNYFISLIEPKTVLINWKHSWIIYSSTVHLLLNHGNHLIITTIIWAYDFLMGGGGKTWRSVEFLCIWDHYIEAVRIVMLSCYYSYPTYMSIFIKCLLDNIDYFWADQNTRRNIDRMLHCKYTNSCDQWKPSNCKIRK